MNTFQKNGVDESFLRGKRERPSFGITNEIRPEPTIDEARAELSEALSRTATKVLKERYGPFLGAVSQPVVNEFLKGLEFNLSRAKGDMTIVFQELLDRVIPEIQQKKR